MGGLLKPTVIQQHAYRVVPSAGDDQIRFTVTVQIHNGNGGWRINRERLPRPKGAVPIARENGNLVIRPIARDEIEFAIGIDVRQRNRQRVVSNADGVLSLELRQQRELRRLHAADLYIQHELGIAGDAREQRPAASGKPASGDAEPSRRRGPTSQTAAKIGYRSVISSAGCWRC